LRARFPAADAEERVELIVRQKAAASRPWPVWRRRQDGALLCGRTYGSTLLIQNISRWPACPPALIAHLLKQEIVRRSQSLRLLLQRHPNAPASRAGRPGSRVRTMATAAPR